MDKERQFGQALSELVARGHSSGDYLDKEVVDLAFADLDLDDEQLLLVYDYLKKHHIGVGEPLKDSDYLESEEIDYLKVYLDEISQIDPFTDGEKEAITMSAMAGDPIAQSRLIEMHLNNVVEIAKLYAGQGVFLEDLIGEGNVALSLGVTMLGALEHHSEADGMLTRMIMDGMEEYISENSAASDQDAKILKTVNDVADKAREMSEELRRDVTVDELAAESGFSRKKIQTAIVFSGGKIDGLIV